MSRRSFLTVELLIRFPLPAGVKGDKALAFVQQALEEQHKKYPDTDPLRGLTRERFTVKLVKRETTYL